MNEKLGERWFRDVFIKQCGPERPQLLILDVHSSYETLGLLELAMAEQRHIVCLSQHTTHILQPLDRSAFGPFNKAYNAACSEFLSESQYHVVNKSSFLSLFKKAFDEDMMEENIHNGLKVCGIVPFLSRRNHPETYHPSVLSDIPTSALPKSPTSQVPSHSPRQSASV